MCYKIIVPKKRERSLEHPLDVKIKKITNYESAQWSMNLNDIMNLVLRLKDDNKIKDEIS